MPLFKEDPTHLSKSRLKSDLVAHNVALPPAKSKKDVYVELHLKHIDQRNAADFSSDEEDEQVNDVADNEVDPNDAEVPDLRTWTDDDLKDALLQHGIKAGPIVATTRALYEKKLRKVLESNGHENLNGGEKDSVVYSDSEEEEEGPEEIQEETGEQVDQDQEESSHDGGFVYPQCFLLSPKLRACTSRNRGPRTKWNSGNALKSSKQNLPHCAQIPVRISRASPIDQRSGLGSGISAQTQSTKPNGYSSFPSKGFSITKMMESRQSLSSCTDSERELNGSDVKEHWSQSSRLDIPVVDKHIKQNQSVYHKVLSSKWGLQAHLPAGFYFSLPTEPVKDDPKELLQATPTGIYATCRRPIKGAAGRPIQYVHPDTPLSPVTLERREVERRLVPIHIQIVFFLVVVVLLYLINMWVEESSFDPFAALLDLLNQGLDAAESPLLQTETRDTPELSAQE
ncbi:uncharacterized protein V6R79_014439 [Siganus canaliculatus]